MEDAEQVEVVGQEENERQGEGMAQVAQVEHQG